MMSLIEAPCLPLAMLSSVSGMMHFYSEVAFKIWVDAELSLVQNAGPPAALQSESAPLPSDVGKAGVMSGDSFEGFSLAQWVQYAKKKSRIATLTTRCNGELKARLSHLESLLNAVPGACGDDPLARSDPWQRAKLPQRDVYSESSANVIDEASNLWSDWKASTSNLKDDVEGLPGAQLDTPVWSVVDDGVPLASPCAQVDTPVSIELDDSAGAPVTISKSSTMLLVHFDDVSASIAASLAEVDGARASHIEQLSHASERLEECVAQADCCAMPTETSVDDRASLDPALHENIMKDTSDEFAYLSECCTGDDLSKEDKVINLLINKTTCMKDYHHNLAGLANYFKDHLMALVCFFNDQIGLNFKTWTEVEECIAKQIHTSKRLQTAPFTIAEVLLQLQDCKCASYEGKMPKAAVHPKEMDDRARVAKLMAPKRSRSSGLSQKNARNKPNGLKKNSNGKHVAAG